MAMINLEFNSGLHESVVLPLTQQRFKIGGDESCDFVVFDPEFEHSCIDIEMRTEGGYGLLVQHDGEQPFECMDEQGQLLDTHQVLFQTVRLRLGNVHITLRYEGPVAATGHTEINDPLLNGFRPEIIPSSHSDHPRSLFKRWLDLVDGALHSSNRRVPLRTLAYGVSVFILSMSVVIASVALMMGGQADAKESKKIVAAAKPCAIPNACGLSSPSNAAKSTPRPEDRVYLEILQSVRLSLEDFKLEDKVRASLRDDEILLRGTLNNVERRRFEKVLLTLTQDYEGQVRLQAVITPSTQDVELGVKQVFAGAQPSVIMMDGTRLYVGSRYADMVVQSITLDKVVLKGVDTLEIII